MSRQTGFTIIEVILFLAISGALTVLIFIGAGTAIQRQQYKESVQSFAGFLRTQYSKVINVENNRTPGTCPISGGDTSPNNRGQSNCVIVGRYITSVTNLEGREYTTYPVYALYDGANWQYQLGSLDTTYEVMWSMKTRLSSQADGGTKLSFLIYRDPEIGKIVIRSDTDNYTASNIGNFFAGISGSGFSGDAQLDARELCVYDNGLLTGERQSVFIGARAGSSDAITTRNASGACA